MGVTDKHSNGPSPILVRTTPATKFYQCVFPECPTPKDLLKHPRTKAGRPPIYHAGCRKMAKDIRKDRKDPRSPRHGVPDHRPATLEDAKNGSGPKCGAQRSQRSTRYDNPPGLCALPAGFGTDHPGYGNCKFHTGNTPAGQIHAVKEMLFKDMPTLGSPRNIDPHSAILEEVQRSAGHVEWLRLVIASIGVDPDADYADQVAQETGMDPVGVRNALMQFTDKGIDLSVWMSLYQSERTLLVRACKMAVDMGCAERSVRVAEDQGRLLAMVIQKVFSDPELELTNKQKTVLPAIVRRELTAIEATATEKTA